MKPSLASRVAAGLLALALSVASASACPSCVDTRSGRARWFAYTTGLLTLLPVAAIVSGAWWLRRAAQNQDAAEDGDGEPGAGPA